jgi:septal ring factor EnvC (AmiA/AmiB activator)
MLKSGQRQAAAFAALCLVFQMGCGSALGGEPQIYNKLGATRDALLSQEREIQRSYEETNRKIDELKQRQAVLDAYLRQTSRAIADIEKSMAQVQ